MSPGLSPFSQPYRAVTAGILGLVTLVAFEAIGVSTAMPVVADALDGRRSYGLAFSLFLTMTLLGTVLAGGWSDTRGPRGPILAGLVLFGGGVAVCGAAPSFEVLLVGRVVSGVGGGLLGVSMYVVIARVFPEAMRPRLFGYVSAAWVLPSVLGPPLAGWLATAASWRLVFLGVLPLVLVPLAVLLPQLRHLDDLSTGHAAVSGDARSRLVRATALAAGVLVLQWAGQELRSPALSIFAVLAAGAVLIGLTLPRLLPPGTLRVARGLASVVASRGLLTAAFFGAQAYVPLMLTTERGLSPAQAGLALTGGAVGWALGSHLQGRAGLRAPRHRLVSAGALLIGAAVLVLWFAVLPAVTPWVVAPAWAVAGMGMGMAMSSTSVLTLRLSPRAEQGRSAAALQLSDALGGVAGITGAQAVYASLHAPPASDAPAFQLIWAGLAVTALVAAGVGARARPAAPAHPGADDPPSPGRRVVSSTLPAERRNP